MSLFVVDQEKCARDGICAAECPPKIIAIHEGGPEPVESMEHYCINVDIVSRYAHMEPCPLKLCPLRHVRRYDTAGN